jgi:hypothetical protein
MLTYRDIAGEMAWIVVREPLVEKAKIGLRKSDFRCVAVVRKKAKLIEPMEDELWDGHV